MERSVGPSPINKYGKIVEGGGEGGGRYTACAPDIASPPPIPARPPASPSVPPQSSQEGERSIWGIGRLQ